MSYQQGPPPQGGYPPAPPAAPPTNTLAIVSLVCAFIFAPAGLICGFIARKQIKQTGESGAGLALAGIIISAIAIIAGILAFVVLVVFAAVLADTVNNLPSQFPTPSPFPTS